MYGMYFITLVFLVFIFFYFPQNASLNSGAPRFDVASCVK